MGEPTFENVKIATGNGKTKLDEIIKGRVFSIRAGSSRSRAWFDFDLFPGNHNLKEEVVEGLWTKYSRYLKTEKLEPSIYVSVTPIVARVQVRRQHAEDWFSIVYKTFANLENLERIRVGASLFGETKRYSIPAKLLRVTATMDDGQVVEANKTEFTQFIQDLTLDYKILLRMTPRDFERAVAAVFSRTGRFDRVILTPASGDEGRDIVLEASRWGKRRLIVELKRYRRNKISAEAVNALIGVLTGEADGSKAKFITTSSFAPRLTRHRSIRKAMDNQSLELLELVELVEGCIQSEYSEEPLHFADW